MYPALQASAIILTAIVMALALAHALELPGKLRLTREQYLAVQPIYYPGFTYAGIAEPIAIVSLAALLSLTPRGAGAFWLIAGALASAVLTQLIFWILTAPVNKHWLTSTNLSPAARQFFDAGVSDSNMNSDWKTLRNRWERSHLYRTATATFSFVLVVIAVVI